MASTNVSLAVTASLLAACCTAWQGAAAPAAFKVADAVVVKARFEDKGEASSLACAANELTNAIFKTTGRMAHVFVEGSEPADAAAAIYIGPTAAARAAGMDGEGMRNGDWRVKCVRGRAFL